ncbi:MAG: YdcF family protein [Verrucomicrobiota bacterium]
MKLRRKLAVAIALSALLALLALLPFLFPEQVLMVDSGPVTADAMVVLGGFTTERPQRAAELFQSGEAPKIILSGRGDGLVNRQRLRKLGVPENAVIVEDRSTSTFENAQFSIPLLRQMGGRRVIIVTSWYHSRRALATFRHLAPDLQFYSRPAWLGYETGNRKLIRGYMRLEYPKLLGYWLRHGICPF